MVYVGKAVNRRGLQRPLQWRVQRQSRWSLVAAALMIGVLLLLASAGANAVEANRASASDLDAIKGIGPVMLERIVAARQQRPFANWSDFSNRVRGVGPTTAARLSANGLRVNGKALGQDAPTNPVRWQPMVPQPLEPVHPASAATKAQN
ncbi:DNA uptake protein and related DNA-binding protein [Serpentinimonas maccroryi]|uniref:DNA uptake protein and related DNA-binding protein n=2 Tax=Serpentinimonas maccroryi TaxID=1458426 RepID=A0A060NJK0_9BURK|nr:DNA uptake protein and related DNA-binding protein [Serpentinimonas maccroryi]